MRAAAPWHRAATVALATLTGLAAGLDLRDVKVDWLTECGCTGIEVEAVRLVRDAAARHGLWSVGLSPCTDTCPGWGEADFAAENGAQNVNILTRAG